MGGRNLCAGGKQLPDLYVLGVQKCSTSSLAKALMAAGVKNVHSPENKKELHFFNMPIKLDYSLEWEENTGRPWKEYKEELLDIIIWKGLNLEQNRKLWYDYNMPDCPVASRAERSVLADFTPDYVRIVPKTDDLGLIEEPNWRPVDRMNISLPKFMRKMYGDAASNKLTFTIMLRNPIAQVQSAWYMSEASGFVYCRGCKGTNFQTVLREHLTGMLKKKNRVASLWLYTAMYARQIEEWLEHYDASQFFVIPMMELGRDDTTEICREFSRRLSYTMECRPGAMDHTWSGKHPPVEDDTTPELMADFNKLMKGENDRLVTLLAKAHNRGMSLAHYHGKAGDEGAIREWLFAGW